MHGLAGSAPPDNEAMEHRITLNHFGGNAENRLLNVAEFTVAAIRTQPALVALIGTWKIAIPTMPLLLSLVLGASERGYNPVEQTVSQLVHYPAGWLQTTDFVVLGVWLLILTVRFFVDFPRATATRIGTLVTMPIGAGFFIIAACPTNAPDTAKVGVALVHEQTARSVSVLFPIASGLMGVAFKHHADWKKFASYTFVTAGTGFVMVAACAVVIATDSPLLGLFERLLMANALLWGLVVSIQMWRIQWAQQQQQRHAGQHVPAY